MDADELWHYRNDIALKMRPLDLPVPLNMLESREVEFDLHQIAAFEEDAERKAKGEDPSVPAPTPATTRRKRSRQQAGVKENHSASHRTNAQKRVRLMEKINNEYKILSKNTKANDVLLKDLSNYKMRMLRARFDLSQREADIQRYHSERELQEENFQLGLEQLSETEREVMKHHEVYERRLRKLYDRLKLDEKLPDIATYQPAVPVIQEVQAIVEQVVEAVEAKVASKPVAAQPTVAPPIEPASVTTAVPAPDPTPDLVPESTPSVSTTAMDTSPDKAIAPVPEATSVPVTDTPATDVDGDAVMGEGDKKEEKSTQSVKGKKGFQSLAKKPTPDEEKAAAEAHALALRAEVEASLPENKERMKEAARLREWRLEAFRMLHNGVQQYVGEGKTRQFVMSAETELARIAMMLTSLEEKVSRQSGSASTSGLEAPVSAVATVTPVDALASSTATAAVAIPPASTPAVTEAVVDAMFNDTVPDVVVPPAQAAVPSSVVSGSGESDKKPEYLSSVVSELLSATKIHVDNLAIIQRDTRVIKEQFAFLEERQEEKEYEIGEYTHQIHRQRHKCNSKLNVELSEVNAELAKSRETIEEIFKVREVITKEQNALVEKEFAAEDEVVLKATGVSLADQTAQTNEDNLFALVSELAAFRGCERLFLSVATRMATEHEAVEQSKKTTTVDDMNDKADELSELKERSLDLKQNAAEAEDTLKKMQDANEELRQKVLALYDRENVLKQRQQDVAAAKDVLHESRKELQERMITAFEQAPL